MHKELTNLLPPEHQRKMFREYLLRLAIVAVGCAAALVVAAMVLLVPTYVFLQSSQVSKQEQLRHIEAAHASDDSGTLTRLDMLSSRASTLLALSKAPSPSTILRTVLMVPRPGVTLTSLLYTPALDKDPGTVTISGTATTRDALRSYQLALQASPTITSADLPVSAYAKDTDIQFSVALTLAP